MAFSEDAHRNEGPWNEGTVHDFELRLTRLCLALPDALSLVAERELEALFFDRFADARCARILSRWGC